MELVKDSPRKQNAAYKAVETFVNSSLGQIPGAMDHQSTFFVQKAYNYARDIINRDPTSRSNSSFHYTKGHLKDDTTTRANQLQSRNTTYSNFLKTNRSNSMRRDMRVSENPEDKEKNRDRFNSVYELSRMSQYNERGDWSHKKYHFDVPDRKQEYYALENFEHQLYNSQVRAHQYRNPKPERPIVNHSFDLNKKPKQLEVIRVSLLEDPNYVNKDKYKFPAAKTSRSETKEDYARPEEVYRPWHKYYKKDGKMIEQPKISALHQPAQRPEQSNDDELKLYTRPLKSDALERQLDMGGDSSSKMYSKAKLRPTSTRFFSYQRGIYDILYPRRIVH